MNQMLQEIFNGIVKGKAPVVQQKIREALEAGLDPAAILNEGMIAAMAEVGKRFEGGEYFVPEMLIAARAMKSGTEILKPYPQKTPVQSVGKVIIGTVKGDLHDIGKNLVGMMLEGGGLEIQDLGTDVPAEKFVDAVRTSGANILGMSALLTTTMPNMKGVIEALEKAGVRGKVKVMVGGAPLTSAYAKQIGADGCGKREPRGHISQVVDRVRRRAPAANSLAGSRPDRFGAIKNCNDSVVAVFCAPERTQRQITTP